MRPSVILILIYCKCSHTSRNWYITEIDKENKNECIEIIKEKPLRNRLFKRVFYKVKKECLNKYKKEKIKWQ